MKKATHFLLGCVVWIPVCSSYCQLHADEPLPPPQTEEVWSPNKHFCAVMNPESETTVVYQVAENGHRTKSWTMKGWFWIAHLADDGEHLVIGNGGSNLLPTNVTKDEPMIRFFKRGKLLNTVTLGSLLTKMSSLERTVSHYYWGHYRGFNEKGLYVVETVEGKKLFFDVTTGKVASPTANTVK